MLPFISFYLIHLCYFIFKSCKKFAILYYCIKTRLNVILNFFRCKGYDKVTFKNPINEIRNQKSEVHCILLHYINYY